MPHPFVHQNLYVQNEMVNKCLNQTVTEVLTSFHAVDICGDNVCIKLDKWGIEFLIHISTIAVGHFPTFD